MQSTARTTTSAPSDYRPGIDALDEMLTDGYWRGLVNALRRSIGHRKDAHGTALHRRRRARGRARASSRASRKIRPSSRASHEAFGWTLDDSVTMMYRSPGRPLRRRVDLRAPRCHRPARSQTRPDRQPHRRAVRQRRRDPLSRIHVLTDPTLLTGRRQPVHDDRATRPVCRHPSVRIRRLPPLGQRPRAPIPP